MTAAEEPLAVRLATLEEAEPLAEILNEIIGVGGTTAIVEPLSVSDFRNYFLSGPNHICCHVAEDRSSGLLFGFQALERRSDLPEGWADIATFARMRPKRRGVGAALFAATARRAQELGFVAINASIRADNAGGLKYYEKMGFETYRTRHAIPLKNGAPIDRILKRFDIT